MSKLLIAINLFGQDLISLARCSFRDDRFTISFAIISLGIMDTGANR